MSLIVQFDAIISYNLSHSQEKATRDDVELSPHLVFMTVGSIIGCVYLSVTLWALTQN